MPSANAVQKLSSSPAPADKDCRTPKIVLDDMTKATERKITPDIQKKLTTWKNEGENIKVIKNESDNARPGPAKEV